MLPVRHSLSQGRPGSRVRIRDRIIPFSITITTTIQNVLPTATEGTLLGTCPLPTTTTNLQRATLCHDCYPATAG